MLSETIRDRQILHDLIYMRKLKYSKTKKQRMLTWQMWIKVLIASVPAAIVGLLFNDLLDELFYKAFPVAVMLIVYGIAFIVVERRNTRGTFQRVSTKDGPTVSRLKDNKINNVYDITYRTALIIGLFQCLSLIPGTSRSGSTILGGILLGAGRAAAAEFSFFMAIPTMLGASAIKLLKFFLSGVGFAGGEISILLIGCIVSFLVSLMVIRGLMSYVRQHSFSVFGVYRIVLGILVLAYFAFVK